MNTNRAEKILEVMIEGEWYTVEDIYKALPVEYKGGMHPRKATTATCNRLVRLGRLEKKTGERVGMFYTKYYKRSKR